MNEWDKLAETLKKEADEILDKSNLVRILLKYGNVHFIGSYYYNLLTWRDIDICLEMENVNPEIIFDIGKEIAQIPNVGTIYYRNEFVLHTVGNPLAIFLCVELYESSDKKWKLDILISNSAEVKRVLNQGKRFMKKLNEKNRAIILIIKSKLSMTPEY